MLAHCETLTQDFDLLRLQQLNPQRYPVLFESSAVQERIGRYDFLLVSNGEHFTLAADGLLRDAAGTQQPDADFFALLNRLYGELPDLTLPDPTLPAFTGGYGIYMAYELAAQVEPILQLPAAPSQLPVAYAVRVPWLLVRDRVEGSCRLIGDPRCADLKAQILQDLQTELPTLPSLPTVKALHEDDGERFTLSVARILEYLRAGDVFQVNLSREWLAEFANAVEPAALFTQLREHNPAPFAGVFHMPGGAVVSASPERLVSVAEGVAQTRPIAGTRARLPDADDEAVKRQLIEHAKERAEHVMLIDLERNDLSRIATPGSVEVDELMVIETYRHVHHIVSNVRATLRADVQPGDVLKATFPGGTITGCPKVRCMQIVAELEQRGRGAYTGAMGWMGRNDGIRLDTNILIRSATVEGNTARFRAGAGIVIDSQPQAELAETRAKARGMLHALGVREP